MPRELWILDDARIMGGGQHFALRLGRFVAATRGAHAVRILCPAGSPLAERARLHGLRVSDFRFPPPTSPVAVVCAALRLRRLLRDAHALVVAGSARCQAVAVAAGQNRFLVHLMHEQDSARRLTMRLLHRRGRVVAVGVSTGAMYGAPSLRNFLLDEDFDRLADVARGGRTGTLGVLARLIPEKGVAELVVELRSVDSWTRLRVAGAAQDAAYADRLRDLIDERTELAGHVEDVARFLEGVDVLVVPSVGHEAQPTVIVEALAAGRPVVVREAIQSRDFDDLPVFPYGDLSAALQRACASPAPDPEDVRARFGAEQALQAIEEVEA